MLPALATRSASRSARLGTRRARPSVVRQIETGQGELMPRNLGGPDLDALMLDDEHVAARRVVVTLSVTRQRAFRRRHPGTQTRRVALTSCAHPRREDALRGNPDRRRARTPSTKATTPSAVGLPAAAPRQHAGTYSRQSIRRRALAASCKESVCRARDCGGQTHGPFLSGPAAGAGRSFCQGVCTRCLAPDTRWLATHARWR